MEKKLERILRDEDRIGKNGVNGSAIPGYILAPVLASLLGFVVVLILLLAGRYVGAIGVGVFVLLAMNAAVFVQLGNSEKRQQEVNLQVVRAIKEIEEKLEIEQTGTEEEG